MMGDSWFTGSKENRFLFPLQGLECLWGSSRFLRNGYPVGRGESVGAANSWGVKSATSLYPGPRRKSRGVIQHRPLMRSIHAAGSGWGEIDRSSQHFNFQL